MEYVAAMDLYKRIQLGARERAPSLKYVKNFRYYLSQINIVKKVIKIESLDILVKILT